MKQYPATANTSGGATAESYSPVNFAHQVLGGNGCERPFAVVKAARPYLRALLSVLPARPNGLTIFDGNYGLTAAALRFGVSRQELQKRWSHHGTAVEGFGAPVTAGSVLLVGHAAEPLRFAADVGLCEETLVAELNGTLSADLRRHLNERADVIVVGSDSSARGIEALVREAFAAGSARVLCFATALGQDTDPLIEACRSHGLSVVRTVGGEEPELHAVHIAYRGDSIPGMASTAASLIVAGANNTLIGCAASDDAEQVETLPHPWHVVISAEQIESRLLRRQLTELHLKGNIEPGDVVTTRKHHSVGNIGYLGMIFSGEYQLHEYALPDGAVGLNIVRVDPVIDANIVRSVPTSAADVQAQLDEHGYLLIRPGEPVSDGKFLELLVGDGEVVDYNRYGNTPRPKMESAELTRVVDWPHDILVIPHNELTYHTTFPMKLAFVCKQPATFGGETVMYDCARAFANLSPELQRKAVEHHVVIERFYVKQTDRVGHPSWTRVLDEQATVDDVIEHFTSLGIQCTLVQDEDNGQMIDVIHTRLARPLSYEYQGRQCFHVTIPGIAPYWYTLSSPGNPAPYKVTWDSGEPVAATEYQQMEEASLAARILYGGWQKNDILFMDNLRIAHGRHPLIGPRVLGARLARPGRFVRNGNRWGVEDVGIAMRAL